MSNQNNQDPQVKKAAISLDRLHRAIGNNALSGAEITSDTGKVALSALLSESINPADEFRGDLARQVIKKALNLK